MPSLLGRSILVAVRDPAQRKSMVLPKAARLAIASGARVTLFHAFATPYPLPDPPPADPRDIIAAVQRMRVEQLRELARPLRAAGLDVDCRVVWDFPAAQAIVRGALAARADLVMAESHRRSRLARLFLTNTDWELIRECPCPVWFIKTGRLPQRPLVLAAVDPGHAHAKPTQLDDRLLQAASAVSTVLRGTTSLLHVEDVSRIGPPVHLPALPRGGRMSSKAHAATLAAVRKLGKRHGVATAAQTVVTGVPADAVAQSADRLGADLLVMGAIARSGLRPAFIGSTAEAVIDAVGCDVLIVKPRGFRSAVPRKRPKLPIR